MVDSSRSHTIFKTCLCENVLSAIKWLAYEAPRYLYLLYSQGDFDILAYRIGIACLRVLSYHNTCSRRTGTQLQFKPCLLCRLLRLLKSIST